MPTHLATSYQPTVHGFHFANDFNLQVGPVDFSGRCNGMAWISLDYFNARRPAPAIQEVEFGNGPISGPAAAQNNGMVQLFSLHAGPQGGRPAGRVLRGTALSKWNYCAGGVGRHTPAVRERIMSSTRETWRGFFVRDDYRQGAPPV